MHNLTWLPLHFDSCGHNLQLCLRTIGFAKRVLDISAAVLPFSQDDFPSVIPGPTDFPLKYMAKFMIVGSPQNSGKI
jgi:hypothetical protein